MTDRLLAGLVLVPFLLGASATPTEQSSVLFSFQDNEIVESSGLALVNELVVTTNDSGDSGRVFAVDPTTGETVGTTGWASDPSDVEALAPARGDSVWVGDIGDNLESRDSVQVAAVPVGRGDIDADTQVFDLTYPDGPRDAESLLSDPTTDRLYLASKSALGGTLYAAPAELSSERSNELTPVGDVLPLATDGAFFADGKHLVIRNYAVAAIYAFPSMERVASVNLPSQQQGEGIAVDGQGRLLLSSEGLHSEVLRVTLPADVLEAMTPTTPTATPTATPTPETSPTTPGTTTESREDRELPETTESQRSAWPWFLTGLIGIAFILVLTRSLRRR
jgi:hypothetical protein